MNIHFSKKDCLVIVLTSFLCAILAWATSKQMRRAYRADVITMITESESDALSSFANQLGGVAAFLGSSLGPADKLNEVLATLRSRILIASFLRENGRIEQLRSALWPKQKPDIWSPDDFNTAVLFFQKQVLGIFEDRRSGTIRISITWFDRHQAAEWANEYVRTANHLMRERAVADARQSIRFLESAVSRAESVLLQQAIYRLMEVQIKAEMFATTRPDFALYAVDPAVPSTQGSHVKPRSALLAVAAAILGALFAGVSILLIHQVSGSRHRIKEV